MSRTIIIVCHDDKGFDVIEDSRISDHLAWDEMIGQVITLTHRDIKEPRYSMDTMDEVRDKARRSAV